MQFLKTKPNVARGKKEKPVEAKKKKILKQNLEATTPSSYCRIHLEIIKNRPDQSLVRPSHKNKNKTNSVKQEKGATFANIQQQYVVELHMRLFAAYHIEIMLQQGLLFLGR